MGTTTSAYRAVDLAQDRKVLDALGPQMITWRRRGEIIAQVKVMPLDEGCWLDEQFVRYTWTEMHLGGRRRWFVCPRCKNRKRVLYHARDFCCRTCLRLQYNSQYERPHFRSLNRQQELRISLGGTGNVIEDRFPPKPKGMHWKTYRRLKQKDALLGAASAAAFASIYGL